MSVPDPRRRESWDSFKRHVDRRRIWIKKTGDLNGDVREHHSRDKRYAAFLARQSLMEAKNLDAGHAHKRLFDLARELVIARIADHATREYVRKIS